MILTKEYIENEKLLEQVSHQYEISGASILNIAQSCFLRNMDKEGNIASISKHDIETAVDKEFSKEGRILR